MANLDKYFIWERPSYPGLLFKPAEACVIPHKQEFGKPWADTLCFFSHGMVRVLWSRQEMVENGKYIVKNFFDEQYYKQKIARYELLTDKLLSWFSRLDGMDLNKFSSKEIVELYHEYNKDFLAWWGFAQVSDVIGMGSEDLLLSNKKFSPEQISLLTTTTRKSYTTAEEEDILQIAGKVIEKQKNVDVLLDEHAKKYFWLANNYAYTKVLDSAYFKQVINEIIGKGLHINEVESIKKSNEKRLEEFKQKKLVLMSELNFDDQQRKLVEFIDYFTWFQDQRKAISLRANHYTDLFIKQIANSSGLGYDFAKFLMPGEYQLAVDKKMGKEQILPRQEHFALLFRKTGLEVLEGDESRKKEKELLGIIDEDVVEFEGTRAMGGCVIGKVRKILQLSEIPAMKKGEVLVTTMTSPDFVLAMKKAAAIVTDQGGVTCHAAVISRELGIPCVIGTKIATRVLETGDEIEVRANHGLVRILNKA